MGRCVFCPDTNVGIKLKYVGNSPLGYPVHLSASASSSLRHRWCSDSNCKTRAERQARRPADLHGADAMGKSGEALQDERRRPHVVPRGPGWAAGQTSAGVGMGRTGRGWAPLGGSRNAETPLRSGGGGTDGERPSAAPTPERPLPEPGPPPHAPLTGRRGRARGRSSAGGRARRWGRRAACSCRSRRRTYRGRRRAAGPAAAGGTRRCSASRTHRAPPRRRRPAANPNARSPRRAAAARRREGRGRRNAAGRGTGGGGAGRGRAPARGAAPAARAAPASAAAAPAPASAIAWSPARRAHSSDGPPARAASPLTAEEKQRTRRRGARPARSPLDEQRVRQGQPSLIGALRRHSRRGGGRGGAGRRPRQSWQPTGGARRFLPRHGGPRGGERGGVGVTSECGRCCRAPPGGGSGAAPGPAVPQPAEFVPFPWLSTLCTPARSVRTRKRIFLLAIKVRKGSSEQRSHTKFTAKEKAPHRAQLGLARGTAWSPLAALTQRQLTHCSQLSHSKGTRRKPRALCTQPRAHCHPATTAPLPPWSHRWPPEKQYTVSHNWAKCCELQPLPCNPTESC